MLVAFQRMLLPLWLFFALIPCVIARGEVVTLEFSEFPDTTEWEHLSWCTPEESIQNDHLFQMLDIVGCEPEGDGDSSTYRRPIEEFNGSTEWFFEFRIATTGDRSMIPFGGPVVVVTANSFGILYHVTIAADQLQFFRDADLPAPLLDITPGIPHTIRLELQQNPTPTYTLFIDGTVAETGTAEGSFPADNSRITFHGRAIDSPTDNTWHYIRYGDIPQDASGDFDSDGEVGDFEVFYFDECLSESGEGVDSGPGCRWADMDSDTDVDCDDYDLFADAWTGPGDPPPIGPCAIGQTIPATSEWGLAVLALLTLTAGTLLYARTKGRTTEAQWAQSI